MLLGIINYIFAYFTEPTEPEITPEKESKSEPLKAYEIVQEAPTESLPRKHIEPATPHRVPKSKKRKLPVEVVRKAQKPSKR